MTEIKVTTLEASSGIYYGIEAHGHAGAAPKGQDIVCAAVSILMQTLAGAVEEMALAEQLRSCMVSYADAQLRVEAVAKPKYEAMLAAIYSFAAAGLDRVASQQPDHVQITYYTECEPDKTDKEAKPMQEAQSQGAQGGDLQLFAAEAGAASEGGQAEAAPLEMSPAQKRQAMRSGTLKAKADSPSDVTYGKQSEPEQPEQQPQKQEETPAQKTRRERSELEQRLRGRVKEIHAAWDRQAEAVRAKYPGFDYAEARANPAFGDLMKRGVDLETAYKAVYFDRLMGANQAATAQVVERGVTERIAARGARPRENGARPGGAAAMKTDVNSLTKADREKIERQVLHGAKISF